jgi:hypothetical protein
VIKRLIAKSRTVLLISKKIMKIAAGITRLNKLRGILMRPLIPCLIGSASTCHSIFGNFRFANNPKIAL